MLKSHLTNSNGLFLFLFVFFLYSYHWPLTANSCIAYTAFIYCQLINWSHALASNMFYGCGSLASWHSNSMWCTQLLSSHYIIIHFISFSHSFVQSPFTSFNSFLTMKCNQSVSQSIIQSYIKSKLKIFALFFKILMLFRM